jgi:SAM-dependent methyltransferase
MPQRSSTLEAHMAFYSVELCRRHSSLTATILDLPAAVSAAAEILAREGMGPQVRHVPGSALEDDFGQDTFDVILIALLVHHFSDEQNRALAVKVARALRPGGLFLIIDAVRIESPEDANRPNRRAGAVLDVYFALTSDSGTWSLGQMQDWQRAAGLRTLRPIWLRSLPGAVALRATRSL